MSTIETMSLEEVDAAMAKLRTRRKMMKTSGALVQRKISTLARHRERLMQQIAVLDEQITQLGVGLPEQTQPAYTQQRPRRRQAEITACLDAIVACVKCYSVTQRATIIKECDLTPANASAYLHQLCIDGRLIRRGEKRATTYTLP